MIDEETLAKYQMTVGIECHVQLSTKTKLFSGADNDERDKSPNSVVCPIDFALPGMLPVLNQKAVELAVKAGKALNSQIAKVSRFDRKHYFYPDLPKGYQTTQMYQPIIGPGYIDVPLEDGDPIKVRINHAHLEEDAGKLTHYNDHSLVDLNRAGTPLIEIVSEPDIHSSAQAKAYASELYRLMTYAGVTRGDLYHGNMRFDVNVSAAPIGSQRLGTRTETKNLNSFRAVERASEYEFRRQVEILEKGDLVVQETRGWDNSKQKTTTQRSKEDAQDYRYMPDADIPPIILSNEDIARIQATMPELPPAYRKKWKDLNLDSTVMNAMLLCQQNAIKLQKIFEATNGNIPTTRRIALWIVKISNVQPDEEDISNKAINISNNQLIELSNMIEAGELNSNAADNILFEMVGKDKAPRDIAIEKNLIQISNEDEIGSIVDEVLSSPDNSKAVDDLKSGSDKVIGFLIGQVMKKSQGKANPELAKKLINERVKK